MDGQNQTLPPSPSPRVSYSVSENPDLTGLTWVTIYKFHSNMIKYMIRSCCLRADRTVIDIILDMQRSILLYLN